MAMADSVTVSIGEETKGTFRGMFFENKEDMLHWDRDSISPYCGTNSTSLKVKAVVILPFSKEV
jgi:hypothetical protein